LEADEKYRVSEAFLVENHAGLTCFECHSGTAGEETKAGAHVQLVSDPSDAPASGNVCAACHRNTARNFESSLHYSQSGYATMFEARSGLPATDPNFQEAFQERCQSCHATCGQCHVSRPNSVGGGLVEEHAFLATPSQNDQCTACHGSRINDEFKGVHEGLRPDVHYISGMNCMDCHSGTELHGSGGTVDVRRDAANRPSCAGCHPGPNSGTDSVLHHTLHAGKVDCPVCHSQSYRNCYQCHVGASDGKSHGIQFPSELDFRIGKNPIPSTSRPWEWVLLRHIPVYPEMYEAYGISTLATFDQLETWKYATPHNIRRTTPQTEACANCHGESGRFLTAAYVDSLIAAGKMVAAELTANTDVITDPPALPGLTARRK
jgi:hypothetical protein